MIKKQSVLLVFAGKASAAAFGHVNQGKVTAQTQIFSYRGQGE